MSNNNQVGKPLKEDVWRPFVKELGDYWQKLDVEEFPKFSGSGGGPLNPLYYVAAFKWLSRFASKKGRNNR